MAERAPAETPTAAPTGHGRSTARRRAPRRSWNSVAILVTLAVVLGVMVAAYRFTMQPMAAEPGSGAPDFTLTAVDGTPVTLSKLRGHPVILDFMATWCKPCEVAFPQMVPVYERYRNEGLIVISIDVDEMDGTNLKAFAERHNATWTMVVDTEGVAVTYSAVAIPNYVAIDRTGRVVARATGDQGGRGEAVFEQLAQRAIGAG